MIFDVRYFISDGTKRIQIEESDLPKIEFKSKTIDLIVNSIVNNTMRNERSQKVS